MCRPEFVWTSHPPGRKTQKALRVPRLGQSADKSRAVNAKQTLSPPYITDPAESAEAAGIVRGQTLRINRATRQTHRDHRQNSYEQ